MAKKRAWNNTNPLYRYLQSKKSNKKTRSTNTMARRKGRKSRRSSSSTGGLFATVAASMVYGAARAKLSSISQAYIPSFAGQYTDEVVLGVAGWYLAKKGGFIGQLGKSALIIESASVGNQLASGFMSTTSSVYPTNMLG